MVTIARSVENETRNGHRNEKRNPNWNHETIVLGLFSHENLKRANQRYFSHTVCLFVQDCHPFLSFLGFQEDNVNSTPPRATRKQIAGIGGRETKFFFQCFF